MCFCLGAGFHEPVKAQTTVTTKISVQKQSRKNDNIQKCNGNPICGSFYKMGRPINDRIKFNTGGRWGFVDYDGNETVPPIYSEVSDFDESGHAKFSKLSKNKKQFQYGLMDLSGNITIPPKYESLGKCQNQRIWAMKKEKVGFLTCTGKEVLPLKYETVIPFSEGIAAYKNRKGLFQYIDVDGDKLFKTNYQVASKFRNGTAVVQENDNWYFIDKNGKKTVGPLPYNSVSSYQDGLYAVKSGDLKGRINQKGDVIIPVEFQALHMQRRERYFTEVRKSENGSTTEFKSNFDPSFVYAKKDGKWGLLDTSGKTILPIKFSDIENSGFVNGSIRVIDQSGNMLFFNKAGQQQVGHELPWKFSGYEKGSRHR